MTGEFVCSLATFFRVCEIPYPFALQHLDVSTGVDFVNSVSRGSACLSVQVVALDKHSMVAEAPHPHVTLALTLQLNAFADVESALETRWNVSVNGNPAQESEAVWLTHRALSMASVRCTLLSWPRQKRSPPDGSTYPSTVTMGQEDGTLNVSPTWTSISK